MRISKRKISQAQILALLIKRHGMFCKVSAIPGERKYEHVNNNSKIYKQIRKMRSR